MISFWADLKKYRKGILILFIITLFHLVLNAQISLYNCIDAALENSYDVKIKSKDIIKNKYYHQNDGLSFLPSILFSKNLTRAINDSKNSKNSFDISAQLNLLDNRFLNYKSSALSLKQANIDYLEEKNNIVIDVIDNYLTLNILKTKLTYYENILNDYKKQIKLSKKLMKSGNKTLFDIYSIEIEIKNNEIELERTKNEIKRTISKLNFFTGLSAKDIDDFKIFEHKALVTQKKCSINKSYSVISSRLSLKMKKIDKYSALTSLFPTIYLNASSSYYQNGNQYTFIDDAWNKYWEVSLNFGYNFGEILKNYNKYKISSINAYQQKLRLKKTEALIKLDVEDQENTLLLKENQITLDEQKLNFASQKFELAKKKYQNGLLDFFMLKDSANQMLSAKISLIRDEKEYVLAIVHYQKSIGEKILNKY